MKRAWLVACVVLLAGGVHADEGGLDGRTLFLACSGCHSLDAADGHAVGPNLAGLAGRKAGAAEGFGYSPALQGMDFNWDEGSLTAWIIATEDMVPGTWMLYRNHLEAREVERLVRYILQPD